MEDGMRRVLDALRAEQAELGQRLDGCDDADWHRPTRCDGWDVADVVLHLAQTNELALASAQDRFPEVAGRFGPGGDALSVDAAAELTVAQQRGGTSAELLARWHRSVDELHDALGRRDPHTRVQWVAGRLSIHTLATTRLAETWIHHGDVAHAFGVAPRPTERLEHIARLAWRTLPYAFARAGVALHGGVAFELVGPDGAKWTFLPDDPVDTTIRGDALELCLVAGRRLEPEGSGLSGEGPDAQNVLSLVRTYA